MRGRLFLKSLILTLLFINLAVPARAQKSLTAQEIKPGVTRLAGARDAFFSPSGQYAAIQTGDHFVLLPAQNLAEAFADESKLTSRPGLIIGFSSSDTLVFSNAEGVFAIESPGPTSRRLFAPKGAKHLVDFKDMSDRSLVFAPNDLLIAGDGNYDWGAERGNIYQYDLRRGQVTKGAQIDAFWYASVSPSGRFVLYEHGAEDSNYTELYDIRRNRNHPISKYFNFKTIFPQYRATEEHPLVWLREGDRFLAEISEDDAPEENMAMPPPEKLWLALFDVPTRKMIWKKQVKEFCFPTDFQQLDQTKALIGYEDGVYELSLADGNLRKNPKIDADVFAVSPNGKKLAVVKSNRLYIASPDGGRPQPVLDLPAEWTAQTAYKGMGKRPPLWSPDGQSLILCGENEMIVVRVD
jgi:hypothetical protein